MNLSLTFKAAAIAVIATIYGVSAAKADCSDPNNIPEGVICGNPTVPDWNNPFKLEQSISSFDDSPIVMLTTVSEEYSVCDLRMGLDRARLAIRCIEDTTSLLILPNCQVASGFGGYGNVDIRIDDREPFSIEFAQSADHYALGLWTGRESIPVIRQMFGAENVRVRFRPFNGPAQTLNFPITGIEDEIDPLRATCNW